MHACMHAAGHAPPEKIKLYKIKHGVWWKSSLDKYARLTACTA